MQLVAQERDKQNRPIAVVVIPVEEIVLLRMAVINHPKYNDPEPEGMRFRALSQREDWEKLSRININDLKEAVNKYIQDHEGEAHPDMETLNEELREIRRSMTDG
jgi:hypothetical protein